ncbi:hypothetical protein E2C01_084309 [Portunus trituberculatus]|uniref:Uncharacterized protein n=1 Tax=Portunus trituberculatus TaxID=210409 RepID=A0A5B7J745_PORTR|nr:hypothetical protein [Portunus trituberculatus]
MQLQSLGHVGKMEEERKAKRAWLLHRREEDPEKDWRKKAWKKRPKKSHLPDIRRLKRNEVMNDWRNIRRALHR